MFVDYYRITYTVAYDLYYPYNIDYLLTALFYQEDDFHLNLLSIT